MATEFGVIGFDLILNLSRRQRFRQRLKETGREIIDLSEQQISEFAGNAMELTGGDGLILALSSRALASLLPEQIAIIERSALIVPLEAPTIELAGAPYAAFWLASTWRGGVHDRMAYAIFCFFT